MASDQHHPAGATNSTDSADPRCKSGLQDTGNGAYGALINLETTITADGEFADRKPVCYRMHPDNLPALTAFRPNVCALANNHILDFGYQGLTDTAQLSPRRGSRAPGPEPT